MLEKEKTQKRRVDCNDVRALITIVNVICVIAFGRSICWFGLIVALLGIAKDIMVDKRVNGALMHLANAVLNTYLLMGY